VNSRISHPKNKFLSSNISYIPNILLSYLFGMGIPGYISSENLGYLYATLFHSYRSAT
jgi:hypothetical protein